MITYFYLHSPGDNLCYIEGDIIEEREKAICVLSTQGDRVWFPRAGLKKDKHQPNNYQVARWVKFSDKIADNSILSV